jgi:hypothetical protein
LIFFACGGGIFFFYKNKIVNFTVFILFQVSGWFVDVREWQKKICFFIIPCLYIAVLKSSFLT